MSMAAITRKPQAPPTDQEERDAAIQAVVNKGLTTIQESPSEDEEKQRQVVIFVPEWLLDEVDTLVKSVRPRTSRRSWLVEAIREKVERDRDIE
jgi:hypothetical protein